LAWARRHRQNPPGPRFVPSRHRVLFVTATQ
jgi:hypothetical protein